jgi:hypothetical protein
MSNDFKATMIFLLGMIISGCGSMHKADGIYNLNPEFGAYTNAYKEYKLEIFGTDKIDYAIDIQFGHLDGVTIGQCQRPSSSFFKRTITIDYTYWQQADDELRLRLMFHELAHCDLNCGHQNEEQGIMNESMGHYSPRVSDEEIIAMFMECK